METIGNNKFFVPFEFIEFTPAPDPESEDPCGASSHSN